MVHLNLRTDAVKAIVFSFLQTSEIPLRLAGKATWNCSVPHWPRFQRHFRCNLRQECINREDEVQCPYSPCSHGGVSIAGHCYFVVTLDRNEGVKWSEAVVECRKVGAYLATLTSYEEWSVVMFWLDRAGHTNVHIGLRFSSPSLPSMWVGELSFYV